MIDIVSIISLCTTLFVVVAGLLAKLSSVISEAKALRKTIRKVKRVVGVVGEIPEPLINWHVCSSRRQAETSEYVKNVVLLHAIADSDYAYFDFISEVNGTSTKIRDPKDLKFWKAVDSEEPC